MPVLSTTDVVIDALGGTTAVARLTGRKSPSAAANWRACRYFPPNTYLAMTMALAARGHSAPAWLWRMEEAPIKAERKAKAKGKPKRRRSSAPAREPIEAA
jgi:hypothetical protein